MYFEQIVQYFTKGAKSQFSSKRYVYPLALASCLRFADEAKD